MTGEAPGELLGHGPEHRARADGRGERGHRRPSAGQLASGKSIGTFEAAVVSFAVGTAALAVVVVIGGLGLFDLERTAITVTRVAGVALVAVGAWFVTRGLTSRPVSHACSRFRVWSSGLVLTDQSDR
jgi:hypothetical protein